VDWTLNGTLCPALRRDDLQTRQPESATARFPWNADCQEMSALLREDDEMSASPQDEEKKRNRFRSQGEVVYGVVRHRSLLIRRTPTEEHMATSQTLRQGCRGYRAMPIQGIMGTQPQHRALPSSRPPSSAGSSNDRARGPGPAACPLPWRGERELTSCSTLLLHSPFAPIPQRPPPPAASVVPTSKVMLKP
jgi:hypothetical protein